jgi:hypothetical protein
MGYGALATAIGVAYQSWSAAVRSGDEKARKSSADHLEWLAEEAVRGMEESSSHPIARRLLLDTLNPVAEEIATVSAILRAAGWR